MLRKFFFFILLFVGIFGTVSSQQRRNGEAILQLQQGEDIASFIYDLNSDLGLLAEVKPVMCLYERMRVWLVSFNESEIPMRDFLYAAKKHSAIAQAQVNHIITERVVPNDPFFSEQWHHQQTNDHDIDSDLAWDITTGGQTSLGDDIVVCVIEIGGAQWDTDDIADNHWVNENEIPNNGVDDDDNGFIDDYDGWNVTSGDDDLTNGSHGTRVCSMIGSTGNNETGVTGVNWDVKMMMVEIGGSTEAAAIAGYAYPLEMRRLYNLTNGQQGAYVVATNSSWGTDNGQPDDAPLWCAMYDSLGVHGVLSCGSTTNSNVNVDVFGDLPTACPSDYLISVARTNSNDVRNSGGYGITTIDLAAPGDDVYLANNSGYGTTTGTSFSSPCVAGGIALLYSAPCSSFVQSAIDNPAAAALAMKSFILGGVDQTAQLQSELLSGGRFNVHNSLQMLIGACDEGQCMAPFGLEANQQAGTLNYDMSWTDILASDDYRLEYRIAGASVWNEIEINDLTQTVLNNLQPCTSYEARIAAYCVDSLSMWSLPVTWTTDGCCINPVSITLVASSDSTLSLTWNDILATDEYTVQATSANGTSQTWTASEGGSFVLDNLEPCTAYTIGITSACINPAGPAATLNVFTPGCDNCAQIPYCESSGNDDAEYIQFVGLGNIQYQSENSGGYLLVPNQTDTLIAGETYSIACTPGYAGTSYNENFRVWIDYTIDGDFDDEGELVFDPSPTTVQVNGTFVVPESITPGNSRMRVSMTYTPIFSNNEPEPCGEFTYGEVEDYCILLSTGLGLSEKSLSSWSFVPQPARDFIRFSSESDRPTSVVIYSSDGRLLHDASLDRWPLIDVSTLSQGLYFMRVSNQHAESSLPLFIHE